MSAVDKNVQLIIAEDDEDDFALAKAAFAAVGMRNEIVRVKDGEELLQLLQRRGVHADAPARAGPRLVILDLNMPRVDGREALVRIKADPALRRIPIVVMSTSQAQEDVVRSYDGGVCSFIHKPLDFGEFVAAVSEFKRFWLELVELPDEARKPWNKK